MHTFIYFISSVNILRVKVHLFNWKQHGPTSKIVIEHENLRLCRLEFYLCIRLSLGEYQLVSLPTFTSVIEEGNVHVNDRSFLTVICIFSGWRCVY